MKKYLLKTPGIRTLLISYIALLIALTIVRRTEYRNLQQTNHTLHELVNTSIQRQSLLSALLKGSDYVRVNVLSFLYYSDPGQKSAAEQKITTEIIKNEHNLAEYRLLISDIPEQQLFNRIAHFQKENAEKRMDAMRLSKEGRISEAIALDKNVLLSAYENFQQANSTLADFVNRRDKNNIKKMEAHLAGIEQLTNKMNIVLLILMVLLGVFIGITTKTFLRKKKQLADSERRYRTFLEQTHEIIEKQDAQGNILFANNNLKERLEYNDEELSHLTASDLLAEESESGADCLQKDQKSEVISNVTRVLKSKSGKKIHIEGNLILEYENGNFTGSTGFFKDVTEKKWLQDSLVESEQKFRQIFNMAPIPMWTFDPETLQFSQVNAAAVRHYGYSEEEFLKKNIMDIRPEEEFSKAPKGIHMAIQGDRVYNGHFRHLKKNGECMEVEIYSSHLLLNKKPVVLVMAVDTTERKLHETRITKAIIRTQEEERYEIGSELHDNVCQVLAAAKMSLGLMKSSLPASVEGLYNQSVESIMLATDEIRNLSHRLAPAFFNNTTLKDSFERLLHTFNMEHTFQVSMYFDKAVEEYPMSREMQLNLYRILQEQLRNIIKYAKATEVELDTLFHKNKLRMRIADNGVGFDVNATQRGIGLANMKRRTEFFSGKMEVNSSPGNGCEIMISIPLG